MMKTGRIFIFSVLVLSLVLNLNAGELKYGSTVPSLKVAKWMKNEPSAYLKSIKGGKDKYILVLCFWATWSETTGNLFRFLNNETQIYKKENVVFIAMSKENQRIIDRYVRTAGEINFSIAADTKSETYDSYMINTSGVPMFFIISRDGDLLWKGSPFEVDRVLSRVVTNTFDNVKEERIEKIRKNLQESIQYLNFDQQAEYAKKILKIDPIDITAINIIIDNYIRDDDLDGAIKYLNDKVKEANYNKFIARTLYFSLLTILQGMDNPTGREYLKESVGAYKAAYMNDPEALNSYAVAIVQGMPMDIVPVKEIYELVNQAIKVQKETDENDSSSLGIYYRSLAKIYYLAGKISKAIDVQGKSVDEFKKGDNDDLIEQGKMLLDYYKIIEKVNNEIK